MHLVSRTSETNGEPPIRSDPYSACRIQVDRAVPCSMLPVPRSRQMNILRELADGTSLMVSELAESTGNDASVISKNLALMRNAGVIINPRGRLFEIAPQFLIGKTERRLDFGYCVLRMNVGD